MQNIHTTSARNRLRESGGERLSSCSAVLAGFHIILCRSCPSAGKFSEITSFNYLLPTAAAALAGWCYTDTGWDLDNENKSTTGTALMSTLLWPECPCCHRHRYCHRLHCESPRKIDQQWFVHGLTHQWAGAGWVLACHNRKKLHFQSGVPPFQSLPPPVPATSTQPLTYIRHQAWCLWCDTGLITNLMEPFI